MVLDTGPLYALLDDRDGQHSAAVALLDQLEQQNADITCAYPAALETHRLMLTRERVTVEHAHALIADALEIFTPELPTLEDVDAALGSLRSFADQKISLTDATIAAIALRLRAAVLTFDQKARHFELMGAEVYGRAS